MPLINRLYKEFVAFIIYMCVLTVGIRVGVQVFDNHLVDSLYYIFVTISSALLFVYSTYCLFNLVYSRKYYFLYSLKYGPDQIVMMLAMVLVVVNYLYYLMYTDYTITTVLELTMKLLSVTTYFVSTATILLLCKGIKLERGSENISIGMILSHLVILVLLYMHYFEDKIGEIIFGIVPLEKIHTIYLSIVPIAIVEIGDQFIVAQNVSIAINIIFVLVSIILYPTAIRIKKDW